MSPCVSLRLALKASYGEVDGTRDLAAEAFTEAKAYLKAEFTGNNKALAWLEGVTSVADVQQTVEAAKQAYESSGRCKVARQWVHRLSAIILHFGRALDVLAQHHPEFVSLAWGTMRFVLVGIINHAELVSEFSKALSDIADVLPRAELNAKLYQTDAMRHSVASLYAHVLLFLKQAVKWYRVGPAGRAISAIFKPFQLGYKDTVDEVARCGRIMESVAASAARSEIREIHFMVRETREMQAMLQKLMRNLVDMQERFDKTLAEMSPSVSRCLQVATINKTISEQIQVDVRDSRSRIMDIQFAKTMDILRPRQLPNDVLRKQKSLSRRNPQWASQHQDVVQLVQTIGAWITSPQSSLLVLRTGPRAEIRAKEITTELITLLQPAARQVAWYLSSVGSVVNEEKTVSPTEILKSLAFQLLQLDAEGLQKTLDASLSARKLHGQHTEDEWVDLLCLMLKHLRDECFVFVEAEDVISLMRKDQAQLRRFLALFERLVEKSADGDCKVKVLVVGYGAPLMEPNNATAKLSKTTVSVRALSPLPARLRRGGSRSAFQSATWKALRQKIK